jgi:hypothetical protein
MSRKPFVVDNGLRKTGIVEDGRVWQEGCGVVRYDTIFSYFK